MNIKNTKYVFIALLPLLWACNGQSQQGSRPRIPVTITGHIKGISAKTDTLFIVEAHQWEKPIHFTNVVNDSFTFNITTRPDYLPVVLASIGYYDSNRKIKLIDYRNDIRSPDSFKYIISAFVMEPPLITINSDTENEGYSIVRSKLETQAYFRTQMTDFGFLQAKTHDNDPKLQLYKNIIKEYPASYYLLSQIDDNKPRYTNAQLKEILALFTDSLRQSFFGQSIQTYIAGRKEAAVQTPNLQLLTDKGAQASLFNPTAQLNIIVLWASWCAPCRQEIPGFKKLYRQWRDKGLAITNVAIDDKPIAWKGALQKEQMPWPQLFADSAQGQKIKALYETEVLPTVVFTDAKGKVLKTFLGFDPHSIEVYDKFVASLLENKQ